MREVVLAFFKSEGIDVDVAQLPDGNDVLRAGFTGDNGRFLVFVRADEIARVLSVYALCPVEAPTSPDQLATVLELVARLNHGQPLASLELDVDTGRMRVKSAIDIEGAELNEALVSNVVYAAVATLDEMLPALTSVIVKGTSPRAAVEAIANARAT